MSETHVDGLMCQAETREECDRDHHWMTAPEPVVLTDGEREAQSLSAIVSLLESNRRLRRERDDALDELHQERIGRQQAADELMRLKDHDSHEPAPTQDGPR